ncbi:glycosyltransferase family 4 protein [Akkermansiaceae bacterium]|nr:glycosyltransferase family 4 protein [Akkermansiaceae bacterium]
MNTAASYAGALAANKLHLPCLWHLRELFDDEGGELHCPRWAKPWIGRRFRQLSTKLIANSRAVALNLLDDHAQEATIVPNAIEDRYFSAQASAESRSKWGLPPKGVIIGIPGTLRPMKGHGFALDALRPLLEANETLHLVITGAAKDKFGEELIDQYSDPFWADRVSWVGEVSDMFEFYSACDLAIIPSSSEPFGRTVIEAMACGLPVIATRVGGIPEIIDDGENGLLVDYGDSQGMQSQVNAVLRDDYLSKGLAEAAQQKTRREYSETVHGERICTLIEDLMLKR